MPPFAFLVTNFPATICMQTHLFVKSRASVANSIFMRFALIFILLITF